MNFYTVDVLTPNRVVAKDVPAESLLVPTTRGQINVLEHHTHIVTKLDTGVLSVFGSANDPDRFFSISVGIAKVLEGKVIILAETSEECTDIDKSRAQAALKNASDMLNSKDNLTDEEIEKYRRKIERAQLRIQLSEFVRTRS